MILSDEGGDAGRLLRRINSYVIQLRRADIVRGSGSALEYPLVDSWLGHRLSCPFQVGRSHSGSQLMLFVLW